MEVSSGFQRYSIIRRGGDCMTFSARRLGNLYGLTAEEMNYLLKLQGFQEGEPGNYFPTEKGKRFMISKGADNGYGGYAFRGWDWNEWDESIISELNVNEVVKASVREDVVQLRKERRLRREAEAESYWEEQQKKKKDTNNTRRKTIRRKWWWG